MIIPPGATDVSTYFKLVNPTTGVPVTGATIANLDATYVRDRASAVKADLTALGSADAAHSDNKGYEVDGTNAPGLYRVDWPDAAFAAGSARVQLVVNGAAVDPAVIEVELLPWQTPVTGATVRAVDGADAVLAPAATALSSDTWTGTKAGYLDVAVSSRGTGAALDAAGVRAAVGLASANLDSQIGDVPTNSELATALAGADDAVLAAIALLNDLSSAGAQAAAAAALAAYDAATGADVTVLGSPMQAGAAVALAALQPNYAPAKAGDAMALTAAYDAAKTAAPASTALSTATWTSDRAAKLDFLTGAVATASKLLSYVKSLARKDITADSDIGGGYDPEDHSLEAQGDAVAGSSATPDEIAAALSAMGYTVTSNDNTDTDEVSRTRGDAWTIAFADLGDVDGWTKFTFTIKRRESETDAEALLQVEQIVGDSNGVTVLFGDDPGDMATDGELSVTDDDEGDFEIYVGAAITAQFPLRSGLIFDLQGIDENGDPHTLARGRFTVTYDVTRATS